MMMKEALNTVARKAPTMRKKRERDLTIPEKDRNRTIPVTKKNTEMMTQAKTVILCLQLYSMLFSCFVTNYKGITLKERCIVTHAEKWTPDNP